jgi:hypothetical protein
MPYLPFSHFRAIRQKILWRSMPFPRQQRKENGKPALPDCHQSGAAQKQNHTQDICPQGKATVRKEVLIAMGFNLNNFTSIFVTRPRQVYYMCYDYGYLPIMEGETEKALIVSRQEYMTDWNPWKYLNR